MPARSAITRATLAASTGWATQPKMTSSTSAGSKPVRVSKALTAMRPSSSAPSEASSVPALQNGVRTPSTITSRLDFIRSLQYTLVFPAVAGMFSIPRRAISGSLLGGLHLRSMIDELLFFDQCAHALKHPNFIVVVEHNPVGADFEMLDAALAKFAAQLPFVRAV